MTVLDQGLLDQLVGVVLSAVDLAFPDRRPEWRALVAEQLSTEVLRACRRAHRGMDGGQVEDLLQLAEVLRSQDSDGAAFMDWFVQCPFLSTAPEGPQSASRLPW